MPRRGNRFSRIKDAFGHWWDVSEFRGTVHGFDVILAFPSWKRRGTGGVGRAQVILTRPLVRHLERFRMNPGKANLPFSPTAMRRLREELGHHISKDIRQWWHARLKDLTDLSGFKFAAKHGKSAEAAHYTHRVLLGKQQKPKLWWTAPEVLETLASAQSDSEIATALGISPQSVRRLRSQCRKLGLSAGGSISRRYKQRHWWKAPDVQAVLSSGERYRQMAHALGIPLGTLSRLITESRRAGLGPERRQRKRASVGVRRAPS